MAKEMVGRGRMGNIFVWWQILAVVKTRHPLECQEVVGKPIWRFCIQLGPEHTRAELGITDVTFRWLPGAWTRTRSQSGLKAVAFLQFLGVQKPQCSCTWTWEMRASQKMFYPSCYLWLMGVARFDLILRNKGMDISRSWKLWSNSYLLYIYRYLLHPWDAG